MVPHPHKVRLFFCYLTPSSRWKFFLATKRTAEDQTGASYPELEWAMDFSSDVATLGNRHREVLEIYRKLRNTNRHKIVPVPLCKIPEHLLS
jgi:hypothetical protein